MQTYMDGFFMAEYQHFYVANESDGYRLKVGGYSNKSTAPNSMMDNNGNTFTAPYDEDTPRNHVTQNCATSWASSWWFNSHDPKSLKTTACSAIYPTSKVGTLDMIIKRYMFWNGLVGSIWKDPQQPLKYLSFMIKQT